MGSFLPNAASVPARAEGRQYPPAVFAEGARAERGRRRRRLLVVARRIGGSQLPSIRKQRQFYPERILVRQLNSFLGPQNHNDKPLVKPQSVFMRVWGILPGQLQNSATAIKSDGGHKFLNLRNRQSGPSANHAEEASAGNWSLTNNLFDKVDFVQTPIRRWISTTTAIGQSSPLRCSGRDMMRPNYSRPVPATAGPTSKS